MSGKKMLLSKLFLYLLSISVFILILSSMFLFSYTSLIPRSLFKLILVNSTSVDLNPNAKSENVKFSILDSRVSSTMKKKTDCLGTQKRIHCDQALLKVYMYDLPPEFHFGLLGWKGKNNQTWPNLNSPSRIPSYPGGLNLQHSVEYWLTLDLLSGKTCTAFRVQNSSQANVVFVPFFSSLSYNRHSKLHGKEKVSVNKILQERLVQFLVGQEEWKRSGGKDHVIVSHHPNSMLDARKKLASAMFVLADFGRYHTGIANIEKDIIAPYRHVVRTVLPSKSAKFEERPILMYFQGAIYRKDGGMIRQELYYLLKDEKDVHFSFGTARGNGVHTAGQGMASSKFCLNIAGDTPSSNRLFDSIASHCVPVIISDEIELPFEDVLDYSQFCLFVKSTDALKKGYLMNLLRRIARARWTEMWEKLKEIGYHFEYQYPSLNGDAVDMIWKAVSHKVNGVRFKQNRNNRYKRSQLLRKNS